MQTRSPKAWSFAISVAAPILLQGAMPGGGSSANQVAWRSGDGRGVMPSVEALLGALHSPDPSRGAEAVAIFERLVEQDGPSDEDRKKAIAGLVELFPRETYGGGVTAANILVDFGSEAIPALVKASDEPDPGSRRHALYALGEIGRRVGLPESAREVIIRAAGDEAAFVRQTAADVLGDSSVVPADKAIPALRRVLGDEVWVVRGVAARSLARLGPAARRAIPDLIPLLTVTQDAISDAAEADDDVESPPAGWIRVQAAHALAAMAPHSRETIPAMIAAMEASGHSGPMTMAVDGIAHALASFGPAAVPHLIEALDHPSEDVRVGAVEALSNMGGGPRTDDRPRVAASEAIPALIARLDDESRRVQERTCSALGNIGGRRATAALVQVLESEDSPIRLKVAACHGLRLAGPEVEAAVPALVGLLDSPDSRLRLGAVEALGAIGPGAEPAVPSLIDTLEAEGVGQSGSPFLRGDPRHATIVTLGKIGPSASDAVPHLIPFLDPGGGLWITTRHALSRLGPGARAAVPELLRIVQGQRSEADLRTRAILAMTLLEIAPERAEEGLPVLVEYLERSLERSAVDLVTVPSPAVDVIEALGEMGPEAAAAAPVLNGIIEQVGFPPTHERAADALRRIQRSASGEEGT